MNEVRHALMVEDEPDYSSGVVDYLSHHGIKVTVTTTLAAALDSLAGLTPNVVILDQFVAGLDLAHHLPALRAVFPGPVVMLTSNTDLVDRILCLETGADDFILKSVTPRELLARLRAAMRHGAAPATLTQDNGGERGRAGHLPMAVDGWTMTYQTRELRSPAGVVAVLTGAERDALCTLMESRGTMVSRDQLSQILFRGVLQTDSRGLDNLLSRVRRRVRETGGVLKLENVRGQGYVFYGFGEADSTVEMAELRTGD